MKAKKLLSLLLSFVLILACVPVSMANAATVPALEVTADKQYVVPGDEVTFTVTLKDSNAFEDGVWMVTFTLDLEAGLELVSGTVHPDFESTTGITSPVFNNTTRVFTCRGGAETEGYKGGDVIVMTFVCKVVETGELTASLKNTEVTDGWDGFEANVVSATVINHEHDYQWVTKTAAKCEVAGEEEYVCSVCNNVAETRVIPALEHDYLLTETEPSCGVPGSKVYTCQREGCGHTYSETIPALEHDYDDGVVTEAPKCGVPGVKTFTCQNCGDTYTVEIPALEHVYDNGVVTEAPKCGVPGVKTYTCQNEGCNHSYTEEIPALEHVYDNGVVTVEPKCGVPGVKTYTCQNEGCDHSYTVEIPALAHSYDAGVVTTEPTCGVSGVLTYTCQREGCGHSYTVVLPALEHDWILHSETDSEYIFICVHCGAKDVQMKDDHLDVKVLEDGTVIITRYYDDGTVVIETRYTNGVRSIVTLNAKKAVVSIVIVISGAVAYEAVRTDEAVLLPIAHLFKDYGADIKFTVKTNCEKLVPVEIQMPAGEFGAGHVVVINKDNKDVVVPATKFTNNGVAFDCGAGVVVKVANKTMNFSDIKGNNWYNTAVQFVSARGIMTGMTASTFAPTSTTTRAQVWTMLARLAGVDTTSTTGNWYDVARAWAMENGISDGTDANGSITREQLVTMLYRYAQMKGASKSIAGFSDADQVSDWAKAALEWAYANGVMNGNADGTLNPKGNTTRAEMAQFFMNFIQNI